MTLLLLFTSSTVFLPYLTIISGLRFFTRRAGRSKVHGGNLQSVILHFFPFSPYSCQTAILSCYCDDKRAREGNDKGGGKDDSSENRTMIKKRRGRGGRGRKTDHFTLLLSLFDHCRLFIVLPSLSPPSVSLSATLHPPPPFLLLISLQQTMQLARQRSTPSFSRLVRPRTK